MSSPDAPRAGSPVGTEPAAPGAVGAQRVPESVREILAVLNALSLGELTRVNAELGRAESALVALGEVQLAQRVSEAKAALAAGNVKEFRRAVSNVTARLGHVK